MGFRRLIATSGLVLALPSAAIAQSSPSYLAGVTDRQEYESWFASLTGDYKVGVEFWVSHRSKPKQATCFTSGMAFESEWMHGCLTAQQRMTPRDSRRKTEPDYRLGWNSIQSPEVQQAIRARQGTPINENPIPLNRVPAPPSDDVIAAECSQEVSLAYQREMIPPASFYQARESCAERHKQEAIQAAAAARDAELRAEAAHEAERRKAEQIAAEQSPDNNCRKPTFAGGLIDDFNGFDILKSSGIKVIDIEHLTTMKWNTDTMDIVCHGTFVLSNGVRLAGTLEMRPNVAGNMMTEWHRDSVGE